jgi:hypothetical protein
MKEKLRSAKGASCPFRPSLGGVNALNGDPVWHFRFQLAFSDCWRRADGTRCAAYEIPE